LHQARFLKEPHGITPNRKIVLGVVSTKLSRYAGETVCGSSQLSTT